MTQPAEILSAVRSWRDGLVGLSRRSQLTQFRAYKSSTLPITEPSLVGLFELVHNKRYLEIQGSIDPEDSDAPYPLSPGTFLYSPRPYREVATVVRNLMRRSNAVDLDRGIWTLYLAFGFLRWKDIDDTELLAPLVLVPVRLRSRGARETPHLTLSEGDIALNPALDLQLQERGIELPDIDQYDEISVREVLSDIRSNLSRKTDFSGWKLEESVQLALFSFSKEAMFKDLSDNEDEILEHPIVQALATSDPTQQSKELLFDPIDITKVDTMAPPEDIPLVLDCDSSQRVAISAALDGKSFVMDGPPGTGKSQTIANMIGALMHADKTVLFVSEKIAALEVVRNRLDEAGLGSYLLELHSHRTTRRSVAQELTKTLEDVPVLASTMTSPTRQQVREQREKLNNYATAMNEVRAPLNRSLHSVLGTCAELNDALRAPDPERDVMQITAREFQQIQNALADIARNWRPAIQGDSFIWRDVLHSRSLDVSLQEALDRLEKLRGLRDINLTVSEQLGWRTVSELPQLISVLEHVHEAEPPGQVLPQWVSHDEVRPFALQFDALSLQVNQLREAESAVIEACGVDWRRLPDPAPQLPVQPKHAASSPSLQIENTKVRELNGLSERLLTESTMLARQLKEITSVAVGLGLAVPVTFSDIDSIVELVGTRCEEYPPLVTWFTWDGLANARKAMLSLRGRVEALKEAEGNAEKRFNAKALQAPVADLESRFKNLHRGLKRLSRRYRADRRIIAGLLTEATTIREGIAHLSQAVSWSQANDEFHTAVEAYRHVLGVYWEGQDTDFEKISELLDKVEKVLHFTGGNVPEPLARYLSSKNVDEVYETIVNNVKTELSGWRSSLKPGPELSSPPTLLLDPVDVAIDWLEDEARYAAEVATFLEGFNSITNADHSLSDVEHLLSLADIARSRDAQLQEAASGFEAVFGDYFRAAKTDLNELQTILAWATALRKIVGQPITEEQLEVVLDSSWTPALPKALAEWHESCQRILEAFAPRRHAYLLAELDGFDDAYTFISGLLDDSSGQQEWLEYEANYEELSHLGVANIIDFCIEKRLSADQVRPAVIRTVLNAWAETVLDTDSRIHPQTTSARTDLIEQFRQLDQEMVRASTGEIISRVNARRPKNTSFGEPGIIKREGLRKRKHLPIRDLISRARNAIQAIKPVFMMSPLAVSQYLPSDIKFDVVIFDEASQVMPGDAINCIYRGTSLILAGDDKQLPPTTFFERMMDDDVDSVETDVDDFQSVLELAKASGAFNNLSLKWHYRSRHEDLIAFSNYKFYDGELITFPSARANHPLLGVEFFHVAGVYRRGGAANNPIEAEAVVERVFHYLTEHPELSLGVVAFSTAQVDAIYDALDSARRDRPDLDRFFDTDDRLGGLFIRPLEQVQGDERDIIILSVGYGPDEAGKITANFGALNRDKGWRRLNVAITRARLKVEVVSSLYAAEVPPSENENVVYFRSYLDYAQRGAQVLAIPYSSTGLEPESPFEDSVISTIKQWGYEVEPQVGAAGYRIDIGVRHPEYPGMFALAVECDGYQYHSAPAARDRDRLRDEVLTGLGWRMHRIWGTSWYRNRKAEEQRLREAIQEAIATTSPDTFPTQVIETPAREVEFESVDESPTPDWVVDYSSTPFMAHLPSWASPGDDESVHFIGQAISAIVEHESPIHMDILYERLREWWDVGRIGARMRKNINRAIDVTEVVRDGNFLLQPGDNIYQDKPPRSAAGRTIEQIHSQEIAAAIVQLVDGVKAVERSELIKAVSGVFGWSRNTSNIAVHIGQVIDHLCDKDVLSTSDGRLMLSVPSPRE